MRPQAPEKLLFIFLINLHITKFSFIFVVTLKINAMDYRIQIRKHSSNVLEKKIVIDGKDKWIVFIAPLECKAKGDVECEKLLKFYNS